jgi:uncharacterized protein
MIGMPIKHFLFVAFLSLLYLLFSVANAGWPFGSAGAPSFIPDNKPSPAELMEKGMVHYRLKTKSDMKQAEAYFLQSAEEGNAKAAMMLFSIYEVGPDITRDSGKAYKWLHRSAELGSTWSAHSLGHKYQTGQGVTRNSGKSAQYFRQAALAGLSEAKRDLALCFYSGQGVPKDTTKALRWMREAAEENVSLAQYRLGIWLKNGVNNQKNPQEAQQWFAKAIDLFRVEAGEGNQQSALNYAYMHDVGYGVKVDNRVAYEEYLKLAHKENPDAQYLLALMYLNGDGIQQNVEAGKKWLMSSYQLGNLHAKGILERNGWL